MILDTFAGARQCLDYMVPLVGFSQADIDQLRQHQALLLTWADDVVTVFYDTLFAEPAALAVFHPDERPEREASLRRWYVRTVSDQIDEQYWAWQWTVGRSHAHRLGAEPMAVAMLSVISEVLRRRALAALGPSAGATLHRSFCRLAAIIVSLITEGYARAARGTASPAARVGAPGTLAASTPTPLARPPR